MRVSIVILTYQAKKDTLECLSTVEELKLESNSSGKKKIQLQIIVVDNNSSDGSVKTIRAKFPQVKIIENKKNLGFSQGNNLGIIKALKNGSDYVLLLNNDTLVEKKLLVNLIKAVQKDKSIGIISPKIYFAPGYEFYSGKYKAHEKGKVIWYAGGKLDWQNMLATHQGVDQIDKGQYDQFRQTDFATGCCMLIRREVLQKIGLFDPKYFLYWEDIDFCQRAKKAGFKIIYLPLAFLWHKNAASSGGAGQKTSIYYQTRNRLIFSFRYASLRVKLAVFKQALIYLFKGSKWQKMAVKDFFLFKFGQIKNDNVNEK